MRGHVYFDQGACEGNIHGPAITSITHSASTDNDNIEIYTGQVHTRARTHVYLAELHFNKSGIYVVGSNDSNKYIPATL